MNPSNEFTRTMCSVLTNLLPFWSTNIGAFFKLGNEYNMGITMVITQLVRYAEIYLDDQWVMAIIGMLFLIGLWAKLGFMSFWSEKQTKSFTGTQAGTHVLFDATMTRLNSCLIRKYSACKNNTVHVSNAKLPHSILGKVVDKCIESDLYLTVATEAEKDTTKIIYTLSTTYKNLGEVVQSLLTEQMQWESENAPNDMYLYGIESPQFGYAYPDSILSIIQCMDEKHKFTHMHCIDVPNIDVSGTNPVSVVTKIDSKKTATPAANKPITNIIDFTPDDVTDFRIAPGIKLTVSRNGVEAIFRLVGDPGVNLYEFVKQLKSTYTKYTIKTRRLYKNRVTLNLCKITTNGAMEKFSSIGVMVNYCLVKKYKVAEFRVVDLTDSGYIYDNTNQNKCNKNDLTFAVDNMVQYNVVDDLYITIEQTTHAAASDTNIGVHSTNCIMESERTSISDFITDCINFYHEDMGKKKTFESYHFVYNGMEKDRHTFIKTVLWDYGESPDGLPMTMINEHTAQMQTNINKLRNKEYYIANGLRRKLSYVFYGSPGTGKTAMVTDMALYDRRHILEIPFSAIKTREEFVGLMNLTEIMGVPIKKDRLIILFDEIDIGLQNYKRVDDPTQILTTPPVIVIGATTATPESTPSPLKLDTILSQLDGAGSYDGLIITAATNNLSVLDPALCRNMRLTPVEFRELRREDVRGIIERFYATNTAIVMSDELAARLPDRKIMPSTLAYMCDQMACEKTIDEFVELLVAV
jgi:hypothetical protein